MAQCYLRDGATVEATVALEQLLAGAGQDDPYRAPANFLLGEARSTLGLWQEAEAGYLAYLPTAPETAYVTWQRIGAVRTATKNYTGAVEAYNAALESSPAWSDTVTIRLALADIALAQGNPTEAVTQYDLLRGDQKSGAWAAEMQWRSGAAFDEAGNKSEAIVRWRAAADADPTSAYAHRAIVALLDADQSVDEYQRGLIDYNNGLYQLAIEAFDRLRNFDTTGRDGNGWYYSGLSHIALDQYNQGISELDHVISTFPQNAFWGDAWLAKAAAQSSSGLTSAAISTYRAFASQTQDDTRAPLALWQAARLEESTEQNDRAAKAYLELAERYPASDQGWRSFQAAGLIYFRQGNWRDAGEAWLRMSEAPLADWTRPVAYYWLGRAQHAAGEIGAALRSWESGWRSDPTSYYGLRSAEWSLQSGVNLFPTYAEPDSNESKRVTSEELKEIEDWLHSWAGDGALQLTQIITSDVDWQRGEELLRLSWRSQGLAAWSRVQQRHADDAWAQVALSLAFRDAGAHRLSIVAAERAATLWPGGAITDAPAALQRLAYPIPFEELIQTQANRWDLDPRLLAAVIRQESRFETAATSYVGAQGLMQVMPGTAQGIAQQLGKSDYSAEQAYWPYVNVEFGAYYVHQGLTQFHGSVFAALAAYNGGPGNAATWREWSPTDDDLMVALINYNETRVYVQSVWAQYEIYRELYPGG